MYFRSHLRDPQWFRTRPLCLVHILVSNTELDVRAAELRGRLRSRTPGRRAGGALRRYPVKSLASWHVSLAVFAWFCLHGLAWKVTANEFSQTSFPAELLPQQRWCTLSRLQGNRAEISGRWAGERPRFPIFLPFEGRSNAFQTEYWCRFYYVQSKAGFMGVSYLKWIMEVTQNKFYCCLYSISAVSRFMFTGGVSAALPRTSLARVGKRRGAFGGPW